MPGVNMVRRHCNPKVGADPDFFKVPRQDFTDIGPSLPGPGPAKF